MPCTDHVAIQKAIDETIANPGFSAALPPLSESAWRKILVGRSAETALENDRLEFLGDALMYATIGRQLYAQCPQGSPHLYTVLRGALHSNATFSKLAEKLDILAVSRVVLKALTVQTFGEGSSAYPKQRPQVKRTADLFETVIGAYYLECGFEPLNVWVGEIYTPLIAAARKSFNVLTLKRQRQEAAIVATVAKKAKQSEKQSTKAFRSLAMRKDNIYYPHPLPAPRAQDMWRSHIQVMAFPVTQSSSATDLGEPLVLPSTPVRTLAPIRSALHDLSKQPMPPHNPHIQDCKTQVKTPVRLPAPRKSVSATAVRSKQPPTVIDLTLDDSPICKPTSPIFLHGDTTKGSNSDSDSDDGLGSMLMSSDDEYQHQMLKVFS